jgi:uncharacterized membrane protein YgcG
MKIIIAICLMFTMICSQNAHAANESVPCGVEPTNMAIDYGDVIGCAINPVGDTDIYHFNGITNEFITILVTRTDDFVQPCVELTAPDNSTIVECDLSADHRIDTVLDQTGTFSLLVSDWNSDDAGDYTISLERINPVSSGARQIAYNESLQDDIDPAGDIDLFFFEGSDNDNVSILVTRTDDFVQPCVELTAPDNSTTVECDLSADHRIDTILDQTGTFSLLVSDWNSDDTGDYTISLQCISGDCLDGSGDGDPGGGDSSGGDSGGGDSGGGGDNNSSSSSSSSGCFIDTTAFQK